MSGKSWTTIDGGVFSICAHLWTYYISYDVIINRIKLRCKVSCYLSFKLHGFILMRFFHHSHAVASIQKTIQSLWYLLVGHNILLYQLFVSRAMASLLTILSTTHATYPAKTSLFFPACRKAWVLRSQHTKSFQIGEFLIWQWYYNLKITHRSGI